LYLISVQHISHPRVLAIHSNGCSLIMKPNGISLIETMIAVFIIAILTAMALPALKNILYQARDEIWRKELLDAVNLARFESRLRKLPVALCASSDAKSCSGTWTDGLLVFIDSNQDGVVHDEEQILRFSVSPSHGSLFWRSFPSYRRYLLFLPADTANSDNGTFWHCHNESAVWAIVLNKTGRTRLVYPDQNGVIKDGRGQALRCDDEMT